MDLSLPGYNGLILTRLLKELGELPRIVVITMHADRVYVDEALRAGADGFLLKTARAAEIRRALNEVLAGRRYVSPSFGWPGRTRQRTSRRLNRRLEETW
jgi:two-component system response regulator NreC